MNPDGFGAKHGEQANETKDERKFDLQGRSLAYKTTEAPLPSSGASVGQLTGARFLPPLLHFIILGLVRQASC